MSKLDELIQELCPDGVEIKKLREVSNMQRGTSLTKAKSVEGNIPVISGGKEPAFYCDSSNRDGETITVAGSGAGAGYVQYWNIPIFANDCFTVKGNEFTETKYLYYFMTNIQDKISDTKKGGGVPHVHISDVENFRLPVPPLEVQREIVRILDNFTELTAQLTAELTARKQQYEYYKNTILISSSDVKQVRLGDICQVITKGTTPKKYTKSGVSFVKTESFDGTRIVPERLSYVDEETHNNFLKRSILEENDILITIAGATIGKCAMVPKEILPANTNQALAIIRLTKENSPKYIMHVLLSNLMKQYIQKNIKGSAQPNLNLKQLNDFVVPLPPLEEQKRVVALLDRFDALCTDISAGLPAEIEARQKQYEYYRDKLLTFKQLA